MTVARLTREVLNTSELLQAVSDPQCGAGVLFVGWPRQFTGPEETWALEYEAYEAMAEKLLEELEREAVQQFAILHCRIQHRLGLVPVGEASVAVAISSPHRTAAFEASQWVMHELKRRIPIWKKDHGPMPATWVANREALPGTHLGVRLATPETPARSTATSDDARSLPTTRTADVN